MCAGGFRRLGQHGKKGESSLLKPLAGLLLDMYFQTDTNTSSKLDTSSRIRLCKEIVREGGEFYSWSAGRLRKASRPRIQIWGSEFQRVCLEVVEDLQSEGIVTKSRPYQVEGLEQALPAGCHARNVLLVVATTETVHLDFPMPIWGVCKWHS
jgi:hypothetical protein